MIHISKALKIPGMMLEPELHWLARQAATHRRIVEVGSWKGRSTRAMADNMPADGTLVAVDTWRGRLGDDATQAEREMYQRELGGKPEGWLRKQFNENMRGAKAPYFPYRDTSLNAARWFEMAGRRFDMIFIDAGHTYEDVSADIRAWRPLLAPGGLFCGHDYHDYKDRFPGVDRAVDELITYPQALGVGSIWWETL